MRLASAEMWSEKRFWCHLWARGFFANYEQEQYGVTYGVLGRGSGVTYGFGVFSAKYGQEQYGVTCMVLQRGSGVTSGSGPFLASRGHL